MENNDFQKDVKNVEENVNQVNEGVKQTTEGVRAQKNGKGKTIALMIIVLVLVLILGVLAGLIISGNGKVVNDNIVKITEKKEDKVGKKIDESKDWVYDADYGKDKENKIIDNDCKSENLKVPFININSADAEKANNDIKKLYEKMYSEFGTKNSNGATILYTSGYKFYENKNILSVVVTSTDAILNGGAGTSKLYIYNFNLETLNRATNDEMAKACGFNSINEVQDKISKWNKRQKDFETAYPDKVAGIYENVVEDVYFIDKDGKLNFVYVGSAAGRYYTTAVVELNKDIKDFYDFDSVRNNNNTQAQSTDYVTVLNSINENNFKGMGLDILTSNYDYNSVKVTDYNVVKSIINEVKNYNLEEKDIKSLPEMNHITISYDNKSISFHYNNNDNAFIISKGGVVEGDEYKCWASNSNDTTVLKRIISENIPKVSKIVKKLSPSGWAGSSMQEVRLYDNGDVYYVTYNGEGNTEENVIYSELIAKNAETIEERMSGPAVEAIIVKGKNLNKISNGGQLWIEFVNN